MKDTGGPAFPSTHPHGREEGMSLRDWFAGMAMQSIILSWQNVPTSDVPSEIELLRSTAEDAYRFADAMLKERSKE
jgi:hypothetical protein